MEMTHDYFVPRYPFILAKAKGDAAIASEDIECSRRWFRVTQ
jgi:hypothetical protein